MALVQFLLNQPLWAADAQTSVTVGDLAEASVVILLGALSWRYMSTLFAVTIFPRMPDDPGVRFAVVTLCRYTVLGIASLVALAAIHLDLAKIGVVLAALGVGLGFGLQEIVSNFVCGIILLLERPIRIGDVVTVAGTTGKVDRINIRATTIINSDNQSMIVPNREFITGNLVNWTLKDKILRVPIKVSVAYGTDPERVVEPLARDRARRRRCDDQPGAVGGPGRLWRILVAVRAVHVRPRTRLVGRRAAPTLLRDPATIYRRRHRHPVSDARTPLESSARGPDPSPGNRSSRRDPAASLRPALADAADCLIASLPRRSTPRTKKTTRLHAEANDMPVNSLLPSCLQHFRTSQ